jgi:fucose 4-O-acetylase-like acetyltransferase
MLGTRDWTIDVLRIFSLSIVILMHWTSDRVTVSDGHVHTDPALHGPLMWTLTWLLQIMPVFFLCGGFANTIVVDRHRAENRSYGEYLGARARRLTTPMLGFLLVVAPVMALLNRLSPGIADPTGNAISRPLWFLAVYLVAVAAAPWAVRAHDHSPWLVPAVLLAGSLTVDLIRLVGHHDGRFADANLVFVWLCCHQFGILHARGTLARYRDAGLLAAALLGVGVLVLMVVPGPYPPTVLGMADAPVSNLSPPTSVLTVLGAVQLLVLTVVHRHIAGWEPAGRIKAFIQRTNALAIVIYLWHLPVLTALVGAALTAPTMLLPADPETWWLLRPGWFLVSGVLVYAVLQPATQWELFCARYSARRSTAVAVLATALAATGVYLNWHHELSLDPTSTVGVFAVLAAGALLTDGNGSAAGRPAFTTPSGASGNTLT